MATTSAGRRILVVDDLAFLRTTVVRLLSRTGVAEIVQAKDGGEALEILRHAAVDCLLTDYKMPDVTGLQLLQQIRIGDAGSRRDLPVVLLTGHAEPAVVKAAQALDVSGVLGKPCSVKILVERLEHALATPVPLKDADHYRQIAVPTGASGGEAEPQAQRLPWLLRSNNEPEFRTAADLMAARRARESQRLSTPVLDPENGGDQAVVQRRLTMLVPLSALQAGTVIAESIVNRSGKTLLVEGTVLSDPIIERLRELGVEDNDLRHVRVYA